MPIITVKSEADLALKLEAFEPWDAVDSDALKASSAYAAAKSWALVGSGDPYAVTQNAKFHRTDWLVKNKKHADPRYLAG